MSTLVALHHRTTYRYGTPVTIGPQTIRLRPAPITRAVIRNYLLAISPEPTALRWLQDASGNVVARALFGAPTETLEIRVTLEADLGSVNPFDFVLDSDAATWPIHYPAPLSLELSAYQVAEPTRPWFATLLGGFPLTERSSVELLVGLNRLVFDKIAYITRLEPGVLSPEQTVRSGAGSCRDVAWLLVAVARNLGMAARFVSGYLIQLADDAEPTPGLAVDKVDLHAWAEIFLPGAGWIGFDATSGLMTGAGHIPLAGSVHPESAGPISGTVALSPAAGFEFETSVRRLSRASPSSGLPTADAGR